jgi:nitroreductase
MECLELALQAPSGSNRQGWQWVFVEDSDTKLAIADIYRANFADYQQRPRPAYDADDPRADAQERVVDSASYLAEHFHEVPVLMIPCLEGRPTGSGASFWGSILPAVWSFMLALRERAMGSAWTTLHLNDGGEERVAELLGIPFDQYRQAGLFPIAHTIGAGFQPASRLPADQVSHWDTW